MLILLCSISNKQISSHKSTAINQPETTQQIDLWADCKKIPYLDGKFFEVDVQRSSKDGSSIYVRCIHCIPKHYIKGSLKVSSNYISHLNMYILHFFNFFIL